MSTRLDVNVEQYLASNGVEYVIDPAFDLSKIDVKASHRNQARIVPLDGTVVTLYAECMRRGDEFPPLVVAPLPTGKYLVVAGNHRHGALVNNKTLTHPAYVLSAATAQQRFLMRS